MQGGLRLVKLHLGVVDIGLRFGLCDLGILPGRVELRIGLVYRRPLHSHRRLSVFRILRRDIAPLKESLQPIVARAGVG